MSKLTAERRSGIKTGYWSAAKKDELVQRLGKIEHEAPSMLIKVCEQQCTRPGESPCTGCPVRALERVIDGD